MKKISIDKNLFLTLLLLLILIPSVAYASWWNPISWFDNWSFFKKIEIINKSLEKKAQQSENKVQNSIVDLEEVEASSTPKEVNKIIPAGDKSTAIKEKIKKVDIDLKNKETEGALEAQRLATQQAEQKRLEEAQRLATQQAEQKRLEEAQRQLNDLEAKVAEQEIKKQKLNEINQQIANLNAKYVSDIANVRKSPTLAAIINGKIQKLNLQYEIDYATLQAQYQQIQYSN